MVALEDGEAPTQDTFENHQWYQASRLTAFENGSGFPEAHWVMQSGSAMSKSSLGDDFLFFASPLTGSYDVEVDATAFDYRESQLVLGGIWTGLVYTHADYALGNLRGEVKRLPLPKRLSDTTSHGFVHTRLQVRDGLTKVFLNGHPVHSYQAPSSAFPWLAVRSMYRVHGGVQDLRITGNPVVPDEIDLIDSPKLLGWYDYYQPPKRESNRLGVWAYQKQLDEAWITAPKDVSLQPGSQAERQLVYARPMMENGLIEYEYWYEPGQWNASPTLGWNAIVLGSDGVRVHRISDGRFGAIGRESVQHSSESRAVAAPQLVAGTWNRVRLQIEENQLSIFVNQELVLEQPVNDEWQHRRFGLFYLADESGLRVRNIRWAGQWPKEVPTLGDQQLARYETGFWSKPKTNCSMNSSISLVCVRYWTATWQ